MGRIGNPSYNHQVQEDRGGHRKPDSVEPLTGRLHAQPKARMIIFLGRQSPGASSDLPGSRNGSGRSVNDRHNETRRINRLASSRRPLCSLIWSCSRWGLPSQTGHPACW